MNTLSICRFCTLFMVVLFLPFINLGQSVGINDDGSSPEPSAILDVKSNDKGLLIPRVDTTAITSPALGLLVFQPSDKRFYYYDGTMWKSVNSELMDTDGDTGIALDLLADDDHIRMVVDGRELLSLVRNDYGIGRIDVQNLGSKDNVFIGEDAGLLTGMDSTFVNSGRFNIGVGSFALRSNTNGLANTGVGNYVLYDNNTGINNTAMGFNALSSNIGGDSNCGYGLNALSSNQSGSFNCGFGLNALSSNKSGSDNVAIGSRTGSFDSLSTKNVFLGANAGAGGPNSAYMHAKSGNLMAGYNAGEHNQGNYNVFLGYEAGQLYGGSNRLVIENSNADSTNALIYGEFDQDVLRLNAKVHIKSGWSDLDGDTEIKLDDSPDDDAIQFKFNNNNTFVFRKNIHGTTMLNMLDTFNCTYVGAGAGASNGFGYSANPESLFNVGIGNNALQKNTVGHYNTGVGYYALRNNTSGAFNTAAGTFALQSNVDGNNNIGIGHDALGNNTFGDLNIGIGLNALGNSRNGNSAISIGNRSAAFDTMATSSVYIGVSAGAGGLLVTDFHRKGKNVMIGHEAGQLAQGDGNVFIGHQAGQNETNSDRLYIENSNADSNNALIYGEFDNNLLRVNGSLNINNKYTFPISDGSSNRALKTNGSGNLYWGADNNGYWNLNGNEIFYNNNIGVGINDPVYRLHVQDNMETDFVSRIDNVNTGTKACGLEIEIGPNVNPANTNIFLKLMDGNGTTIGSITGNGSGGVLYNTTSDRRLKHNINPFYNGIDLIKQINTYTYEMKSKPNEEHLGFIAQEIYELFPHIVSGTPETTDVENPMMVDYSKMVPLVVAATNELVNENETLHAIVLTLQAELDQQRQAYEDLSKRLEVLEKREGKE